MIIENGTIRFITLNTGGIDQNGDPLPDIREESESKPCNLEVISRTQLAGSDDSCFERAVYSIIIEEEPPSSASFLWIEDYTGRELGECQISNIEPLSAVGAFKITAYANQR